MKLKRVRISMWIFMEMLTEGASFIDTKVVNGLPPNCKFQYVIQTDMVGMFDFVVYNDSFPELEDGEVIPFLHIQFEKVTRQ